MRSAGRFLAVLGIAALCGLTVYGGGRGGALLLGWIVGAGRGETGLAVRFAGFALGALAGGAIAYLIVRRFRVGASR